MHPVVFTIPYLERDIPGYGLALMAAFLISIWWATRRAERSGANPDVILNCGFVALVTGVIGCRVMYVVHYWEQFSNYKTLAGLIWSIVDVSRGGLEFYGGFILATICTLVWLKFVEKVSLRWYMDIIAPSAALGLAIGRVGCFLNGCCYGGVCEQPWAVHFPFGSPAVVHQWSSKLEGAELPRELLFDNGNGVMLPLRRESIALSDEKIAELDRNESEIRSQIAQARERQAGADQVNQLESRLAASRRVGGDMRDNMSKLGVSAADVRALADEHRSLPTHPTQLYSTITALLIALLLNALYWRRKRDGQVILTLFLIEPVTRWMIEVIRADNPVDTLGVFTISQGLAVTMMVLAAIGLYALRGMPPRSPAARIWRPEPDGKAAAANG